MTIEAREVDMVQGGVERKKMTFREGEWRT